MTKHKDIYFFELNNPQSANAFDLETSQKLVKALIEAEKAKVKAFIMFSQNQEVFCSGGNLSHYAKLKTPKAGIEVNRKIRGAIAKLKQAKFLTFVAVEGDCIGGGVELAAHFDFVIAANSARFRCAQVLLGLSPGWGGLKQIIAKCGYQSALDWITTGRWFMAHEASQRGLVYKVVGSGKALLTAEELASEISAGDMAALYKIKTVVFNSGRGEEKLFESLWGKPLHKELFAKVLKGLKKDAEN